MDWILNHLFVVFIVAAAVANMVQKAKRAGAQQQARRTIDRDAMERTRRVQEEIRRKIAERAGRPPVVPPSLATEPPAQNIFQELARQMAEAKKMAEMQERARAAAEAQAQPRADDEQKSRELAEARQLAEARRTQQRPQQTVATAVADSATDRKTTDANARDKLLASLREPDGLRRAWLLREILGEPVGLR